MNRRMSFVVGATALAACGSPLGVGNLDVTVGVQPTRFRPGSDTAVIGVAVHNHSDREVTVSGSSTCILRFEVRNRSGQRVDGARWCTDDLIIFRIAPRDSLARTFKWSGEVWPLIGYEFTFVESGVYQLFGVLDAAEGEQRSAGVEVELLQSSG